MAASISVQKSIDDPYRTFLVDITATANLLEECRKHNTRLVFVSTCMVYAPADDGPIDERHPVQCSSPYAASKLAAEKLVESYNHAYGLWTVTLRPFNTYGPKQGFGSEGGVIARFLWQRLSGKPITVFGDGKQMRDFMYVADCARFIVIAGFKPDINGLTINAGSGKAISIDELAKLIAPSEDEIRYVKHPHPRSEKRSLVCDYSLARKLLDWTPTVDLEAGLMLTESWLQHSLMRTEDRGGTGIATVERAQQPSA